MTQETKEPELIKFTYDYNRFYQNYISTNLHCHCYHFEEDNSENNKIGL